ncbi:MAG: peptidoglycan-binding protein [Robiginitomaculum sp.]|nr:peptidoglycan-binding protein [Robiginitomaculum sp.]MDQ7077679.1 peptidoglycan-binding protein [Robiginitomaculum sp.]
MATGPWSVKGIDPRAREAAKAAAQREGLTLGEWMNQRLLPENPAEGHTPYNRAQPNGESYDRSRFGAPNALSIFNGTNEHRDLHGIVEELTARLEAAERRSTLAITGIDQSVLGMLTRLESVEKVNGELSSKLDSSLKTLETVVTKSRNEIDRVVSKVDRATEDSARRIDTVAEHTELQLGRARHELSKELELVNTRSDELSQRLSAAERMTDNAVRTLEASFASVDERLRRTEKKLEENSAAGLSETFNRRFKSLSEELIQVVAQTRGQLAAQIEAQAAAPRMEQFEASLREVRGHIANAERRHADTLERIAREVGKLGGAIDHRFSEAERNTAISLDKMLDARFRDFQNDHATAIDKIGDGMTGAITRLEEKFNTLERQRSTEDSLEARILASEERTAKMVEDALQRLQDRLDSNARQEQEEDSPVQKAMMALASRLEALESANQAPPPFDPTVNTESPASTRDETASADLNPALEEVLRPPHHFAEDAPPSLPPLSTDAPNEIDDGLEEMLGQDFSSMPDGIDESVISPIYGPGDNSQYAPAGATADARFVAAARRSVRMSGAENPPSHENHPSAPGGSRKLLMAASFMAIIAIIGVAGGITFLEFGKSANGNAPGSATASNLGWDALIDGTEAPVQSAQNNEPAPVGKTTDPGNDTAEALDGPAYASPPSHMAKADTTTTPPKAQVKPTVQHKPARPAPQNSGPTRQAANHPRDARPKSQPTTPVSVAPLAQQTKTAAISRATPVRQQTTNISATGRLSIQQAAANGDPIAQFQLASAKLDAGDTKDGVALMRQAANRGLPIAQYRLGKLYEEGTGVPKDLTESRRWTERAANGGNRRAMHNLAMMYAEGSSVPQSYETAAKWFQEAARMGLTNSQYNLAFLYEQGLGVPESLAQAYAWYSIAAKAGDKGAKERADEIGATLPSSAKNEANTIIANFRPRPLDLAANGVFRNVSWARPQLNTAPNIARAQILLARLGYKPGPADGNPGKATRNAIIAYERDQGLAQTGRIDSALLAKLENSAVN